MFQTVDGRDVFVVDFDTIPELPILWSTEEEKPYALAFGAALTIGIVTEPGKYGIEITNPVDDIFDYNIFAIKE